MKKVEQTSPYAFISVQPCPDKSWTPVVRKIAADISERKKRKVAAYCRVSTLMESQEDSLESQCLYYEQLISSNPDWESAGIFADAGKTGTCMDSRSELQKLLTACKQGKVDLVLTKSISRFTRNISDCLIMVRMLSDSGVDLWFEREGIHTDTTGSEFLLSILACLAEEESRSISDNIKWGIQVRFKTGTYIQAHAPYGYQKKNGTLVILPEEAAVVRFIFQSVLSGKGTSLIARDLNSLGIPSPAGRTWGKTSLLRIIRNPVYAGDLIYQKTYTDAHFCQHLNRGEIDQYYYISHHEAVISKEVYMLAANNVLQRGKEHGLSDHSAGAARKRQRSVFSGKIFCSLCGSVMYRIDSGRSPVFICSAKYTHKSLCNAPPEMEDTVKNAFLTCLNKLKWSMSLSPKNRIPDVFLQQMREVKRKSNEVRIQELDANIEKNRRIQSSLVSLCHSPVQKKEIFSLEKSVKHLQEEKKRLEKYSCEYKLASDLYSFLSRWEITSDTKAFPQEGFQQLISHASLSGQQQISFFFVCSLVLTESIH